MAAFKRCVLAVAGAGGNSLASEWSQQLLDDIRNVADDDLLDQNDVWTAAHQTSAQIGRKTLLIPIFNIRRRNVSRAMP